MTLTIQTEIFMKKNVYTQHFSHI